MARSRGFEFDHAGMEELLRGPAVRKRLAQAAEEITAGAKSDANVRRHGLDVQTRSFESRSHGYARAGAAVDLDGFAGVPVEAKYGVLKRSAESHGLDVRGSS